MKLRDVDRKILSELMQNFKKSDRELAKKLRVSQPTVTRRRAILEKAGMIKEYTVIPNFVELGYHIMAITLLKYGVGVDKEKVQAAREKGKEIVKGSPSEMVMAERGMGIGYDGITISFHKNYSSFTRFKNRIRQSLPVKDEKMDSFLVNLDDELHFRPLTFSTLAKHMLEPEEE